MTEYIFYFLSFLALMSAVMVVASKNPVHSVLYLIITFFAIAGHYVLLNAQFLAAVHVIVYAGAIMVLFLYVIMLLNLNKDAEPHKSNLIKFAAVVSGGIMLTVLVAALKGVDSQMAITGSERNIGLVKNLGNILFTEYLFPFEVSSVLFLAAMVGAVMLGKNEPKQ
ncbi:MAG: NADH-quinone oxidoreductase subunit J [Bacteroidetes bacterium]|nr:MAG: NADH-quinone oxidoreductase subunit J [Bacteroidota bacterium]